jgi:hypothetical protein
MENFNVKMLRLSDYALMECIRLASNPSEDPEVAVQQAKEFLDSLSPELRRGIFKAITEGKYPIDEESKKKMQMEEERKRLFDEKTKEIRENIGIDDIPIAWPVDHENEIIRLNDIARPRRGKDVQTWSPNSLISDSDASPRTEEIEKRKNFRQEHESPTVRMPTQDSDTVPLRIVKEKDKEQRDVNWWRNFSK